MPVRQFVDVGVDVDVIAPLIVAALGNGNDTVDVIDLPWTRTQPVDGRGR